ncbi:hypothetical protein ACB092_05G155500 [Castanea dentata]
MDTWILETCLKLLLKVALGLVVVQYLVIAVNARNSMSKSNSSEENTKYMNLCNKAYFRFVASFLLFVVFSNITGPLFVQLLRSRTMATAVNQLAIFRSGKELMPTNYFDLELL